MHFWIDIRKDLQDGGKCMVKGNLKSTRILNVGKYVGLTRNRINIPHGYIVIGNQVINDKFVIYSRKRALLLAISRWMIPLFCRAGAGGLRSLPSNIMTSSSVQDGAAAMNATTKTGASSSSLA